MKTGCSPFLADALDRGWITHLAFNGATAIHDFEIACFGETSRTSRRTWPTARSDWRRDRGLDGRGRRAGHAEGLGCGEALGRWLARRDPPVPHARESLMARAWERGSRSPSTPRSGPRSRTSIEIRRGGDGRDQPSRLPHPRGFAPRAARRRPGREPGLGGRTPEVFVKALNVARHLWPPSSTSRRSTST